ncbi:MAG: hypothetical protein WD052_08900, partial [Bacteroidales bacterium]
DSALMIRNIERVPVRKDVGRDVGNAVGNASGMQAVGKQAGGSRANGGMANGGLQFRSGGGITGHSEAESEYREMIEKVYVPIIRV